MWFFIFMFCCNLLIPLAMIIFGRMMQKHPPMERNMIFGYRTTMSMKNQETWDFAQITCGNLWWRIGWTILFPTILVQFPFIHSNDDTIGEVGLFLSIIQCSLLVGTIFPVERALKKNFNSDGTRK